MTGMDPVGEAAGCRPYVDGCAPLLAKQPGPDCLPPGILPSGELNEKDSPGRRFVCVFCGETIAAPGDIIGVDGASVHDFANPGGVVFRICCFSRAGGCISAGAPTEAHTWFRGFAWRYAHCRGCGAQMGWRYESRHSGFYGLILKNLAEGGT
ncbi:MAG TPA: cereblon family protein [Spirochaetota bacterium]|nr:cereblon family protein [Spirochaetota bacterium]